MEQKTLNGTIVGYDPGGNGSQGVAKLSISASQCTAIEVCTLDTAEDVISWIDEVDDLIGIGVDTLACWSTGSSGWRAADIWLRKRYKEIHQSVVSPNGLYGSMGLNGMAVLVSIREKRPDLPISETHPKVLYWALQHKKYDYTNGAREMDLDLSDRLGINVRTANDHEWDAAVSALAALRGMQRQWTHDLFRLPTDQTARLVLPCGQVQYWWPE